MKNYEKISVDGFQVYSKSVLKIYDFLVLKFSNDYLWKCSSSNILRLYDENIGKIHLDIGVGTGYFLNKCIDKYESPEIYLMDMNSECLRSAAERIGRINPKIINGNVLEKIELDSCCFDSIGLSLLLHCLPGTMEEKSVVFSNIKPVLKKGGRVFGATVLGAENSLSPLACAVMRFYNKKGIFSNSNDSFEALEKSLSNNFDSFVVKQVGNMALFVATK